MTKHDDETVNNGAIRYDVSVKVRDTVYIVLYTPRNSANSIEYAAGSNVLVLIGANTLTIPNRYGGTIEAPILKTETLPPEPTVDWSKSPGQYFSMKMRNLTERLSLTDEQLTRIRPMAEQESAEVGAVCFTPTVPRKERLARFENIVRSSDEKMRSILSARQWEQLLQLRKEQKQELKKLLAEAKN